MNIPTFFRFCVIVTTIFLLPSCEKEKDVTTFDNKNSNVYASLMPKKFSTRNEILGKTGLIAIVPPIGYIPTRFGVWQYDSVFLLRLPDGNPPADSMGISQIVELYEFDSPGDISSKPKTECDRKLGKKETSTSIEITCDGIGTECSITSSSGGTVHIIICRTN